MLIANRPRNRGEFQRVLAWKPQGVVFVGTAPDSVWRRNVERSTRPQLRDPSRSVGPPVVLAVRAASSQPVLGRLGQDLSVGQSATTSAARPRNGHQVP